jgi:hypothetical protein
LIALLKKKRPDTFGTHDNRRDATSKRVHSLPLSPQNMTDQQIEDELAAFGYVRKV